MTGWNTCGDCETELKQMLKNEWTELPLTFLYKFKLFATVSSIDGYPNTKDLD